MATNEIAPATGRARLSYRRAAELFEAHTADYSDGLYTLHQLRHSRTSPTPETTKIVRNPRCAYKLKTPPTLVDSSSGWAITAI